MSEALRGKPKPWLQGRRRPDHARLMKAWWTPERREAKRKEVLRRNPGARYHGLSTKAAAAFVRRIGRCDAVSNTSNGLAKLQWVCVELTRHLRGNSMRLHGLRKTLSYVYPRASIFRQGNLSTERP